MTPSQMQIVNDVNAKIALLDSEGKAAVAKGLSFIHRFSWTILVGGIIIGALATYVIERL